MVKVEESKDQCFEHYNTLSQCSCVLCIEHTVDEGKLHDHDVYINLVATHIAQISIQLWLHNAKKQTVVHASTTHSYSL